MNEHEFYADPTVFDLWQDRTHSWFGQRFARLRPYAWSNAFLALAAGFFAIAAAVLVHSLYQRLAGDVPPSWNQSWAQWLTVLLALLFCHELLEQALRAWPPTRALPPGIRRLLPGGSATTPCDPGAASARRERHSVEQAATVQATRLFFVGARAAGVNVAIARALFAAGIRSVAQLRAADDVQLLQIHGVGPATVRRLRARFSQDAGGDPPSPIRIPENGSNRA